MYKLVLFLVFLALPSFAVAQERCQCDYQHWVGDCRASIELRGQWFSVKSNTQQCSRVDWYADENPRVTIVTDGEEMEEWLGQSTTPELVIQSCKICKDNALSVLPNTQNGARICEIEHTDSRGDTGTYSGQCQNGVPHGQGQVSYYNGGKFIGQFNNGKRLGQGTRTWPGGVQYVGEWRNDQITGQGTVYDSYGTREKVGYFQDGKLWDGWIYTNRPSGMKSCEVRNNQFVKPGCSTSD